MENILTDENFEKQINAADKFVLVDFFATWCEPCSILAPILEKTVKNFSDKIILIKANVDDIPATAQKFGAERIPMVIMFKNGKQIGSFVGLIPENAIQGWLENILKENIK